MTGQESATSSARQAPLPPRWVVRTFWTFHRGLYALTRGRFGLRPATTSSGAC